MAAPPPSDAARATRGRALDLLPLALVLLVAGWLWAPLLRLPLTGEDFYLFARIQAGEPAVAHVFRPTLGAWLAALHGLFGAEDPLPLHAASLALHLANAVLLYLLALRLLGVRSAAVAVAALFVTNVACMDALAWLAAVNRPLSSFGALLALNGLALLTDAPRRGAFLTVLGLFVQLGMNEEVYGTLIVSLVWLGAHALRERRLLRPAGLAAALALALLLLHLALHRVPGGATETLRAGLGAAPATFAARLTAVAHGWGLPAALGFVLAPLGLVALLAAGRRRAAALGALAWAGSFVPFVLSDPTPYRFYPTVAPTALLLAGGVVALVASASRSPWTARMTAAVLALLAVLGSNAPRAVHLERWRAATRELSVCAPAARELAERLDEPPVLVNLDSSSLGPFFYYFGVLETAELFAIGFLDAATAYEWPDVEPPSAQNVWYGRRFDGTYGEFGDESYFASRTRLEPLRLYDHAVPVGSLEAAQVAMASGAADLAREVLVEGASGLPEAVLQGDPQAPAGELEIVEPFEGVWGYASMVVRVRAPAPVVLVSQEHWLFEHVYRFSRDQAIFVGVEETRQIALRATVASGAELPTFHANAYGLGVLVPAGEEVVRLEWTFATTR